LALTAKKYAYEGGVNLSCFELLKQLTDLKREYLWLYDAPSSALQHSLLHLEKSFLGFYSGKTRFPVFKSKSGRQSFHVSAGIRVNQEKGLVFIPKLKWMPVIISRCCTGTIRNATLSKSPIGDYYISIVVDTGEDVPSKNSVAKETSIGIDLGLSRFATFSDGTGIENPKYLQKAINKLRTEQRSLQRKCRHGAKAEDQSNGYKKQKMVVAKIHEMVSNQRKDFLHKLSTSIIKKYDTIILEDLNVVGMVKNKNLSRPISDAGWGMFVDMLKYKCEWYGKNFEKIGRFEPSSKTCSCCGHKKEKLGLGERTFNCENCGTSLDRDYNAAINIREFGLSKINRAGACPSGVKTVH
jgi:putative transposase